MALVLTFSMKKQFSGLNIELGNASSKVAFDYAKSTFKNRGGLRGAIGQQTDGSFSNIIHFGKERIGIASDGVGTKIELAERTGDFTTIGFDLVAMVADDLATAGFEPADISNVIDVNFIDKTVIADMMKGFAEACTIAKMAITGGEIAELGARVGGYGQGMHVNWSATAIGFLPGNRQLITGSNIQTGDIVIALKSRGFRSNGFSLLRKIMTENFGDEWHHQPYDEKTTWGQQLLTPSLIYSPLINRLLEDEIPITGIAHITGGGIKDNFRRVLKSTGKGAILDNLFEPLEVMQRIIKLGKVAKEDAYLYWNMGNGMLLTAPQAQVTEILCTADSLGYLAQAAGKINDSGEVALSLTDK